MAAYKLYFLSQKVYTVYTDNQYDAKMRDKKDEDMNQNLLIYSILH